MTPQDSSPRARPGGEATVADTVGRAALSAGLPLLVGLAVVTLVVVHGALAWGMPGPTIIDNELGYLANARVLGGLDSTPVHPLFTATNYIGYSLLLVPLYWLRLSPDAIYQSALIINTFLGVVTMLLGYVGARRMLGLSPRRALVAGFVVGLYPAVLLNGSFAWAENLLFVIVLLLVCVTHRMIERPGIGTVAAYAAIAALLPLTHPRMLVPVGLAGALLIALLLRRRIDLPLALIGAGTLAALVVAGLAANRAVMPHIYGERAGETVDSRLDSYTAIFGDPDLFRDAALRVFGGVWYLGVGSAGLVLAGTIVLLLAAFRRGPLGEHSVATRWTAGFVVTSALAALLTSAATIADGAGRVDYLFYGRYVEAWAPVLLLPALHLLLVGARRATWRIWGGGLLLTAMAGAVVYFGNGPSAFRTGDIGGAAVLSVLAPSWTAFPYDGVFRLVLATVVAVGVGVLILLAWSRARLAAAALLAVVFIASAAIAQSRYVTNQSEAIAGLATLHEQPIFDDVRDLSYDMAAQDGPTPATLAAPLLQFKLPGVQFHLFDSAAGELPDFDVVIAEAGWPDAEALGATMVAAEPHADQVVWVLPGSAVSAEPSRASP